MERKYWYIGGSVAALALLGWAYSAKAADLGGNCCGDLEERVAELEATTARKGNRKVSLVISGQVSKALLWHDMPVLNGENSLRAIDNPNSGTRIRIEGMGKLGGTISAGFLIELGIDESKGRGLYDASLPGVTIAADDISLRHSAVWLQGPMGRLTLGQTSTATDGIVEVDLSNANIASLPMSAEPLWTFIGAPTINACAPGACAVSLNPTPFDGGRAQIVRYDSPTLAGFTASAAWGAGQTSSYDNMWDLALRYAGESGGFRFAAGVGYRVESMSNLGAPEIKTLAGSASVMHVMSGLFLTVAAGRQDDNPIFADMQMWQVRGGIERAWMAIGKTTLFAEYGDHKLTTFNVNSSFYGAGIVQAIDGVAMDIGVAARVYDFGGVLDTTTVMGFARIKF